MTGVVVLAAVVGVAVLVWPGPSATARTGSTLRALPQRERPDPRPVSVVVGELLRRDPVDELRAWWRRRPGRGTDDDDARLVDLLEVVAAALRAGLGAGPAVRAALAALPADPAPGHVSELRRRLDRAAVDGLPLGAVWRRWAEACGGRAAIFVAGAWELSDRTGAPLAEAVEHGAVRVRDARVRQGRVASLTAGSRATVTLLTVLPLAGPLLGVAYGVGPAELYLSSPLVTAAVVVGLVLLAGGRAWCRRLVAAEEGPS